MSLQEIVVTALLCCHNRKDKTVRCLELLGNCTLPNSVELKVILVDDGSSDGTAVAVRSQFPQCLILPGSGALYWGGAMRLAMIEAVKSGTDYLLWLNDDVYLYDFAIESAFEQLFRNEKDACIVVGWTEHEENGVASYGGVKMHQASGISFNLVDPRETPSEIDNCDTFNGQFVLFSSEICRQIGNLDQRFPHFYGDYDYGLRARSKSISIKITSEPVGICPQPSPREFTGAWERWTDQTSIRKMYPLSWFWFCLRHSAGFWPADFVLPYLRILLPNFKAKLKSKLPWK